MKTRTIEELHDKRIGHRKMAAIADGLISHSHTVDNIKEYNETFKFNVDGFVFEYRKDWKSSAKDFVKYIENILEMKKNMKGIWRW